MDDYPAAMARKASTTRKRAPAAIQLAEVAVPYTLRQMDELVGHARARDAIDRAMRADRVHHAWVFHGPAGVGKYTTAIAFAAMLLDPTLAPDLAGALSVDPGSETQAMLRAGSHPDLHIITKELALSSSDAATRQRKQMTIPKGVIEEFVLEPIGRTRVVKTDSLASKIFIIDEAELLDDRTQNSLLKTMEEPAPGAILILVTSQEERLLPTIRSRCQRVGFGPLDAAEMERWLPLAGIDWSGSQLDWLLRFAAGSPGRATLAIEQDLYRWEQTLSPMLRDLRSGRYPAEMGPEMIRLIEEGVETTIKANKKASKDAANKAWTGRMLSFIAEAARAELPTNPAFGLHIIDAVSKTEQRIRSNVNLKLALESMVVAMATPTR